jgi:hypothetical protein
MSIYIFDSMIENSYVSLEEIKSMVSNGVEVSSEDIAFAAKFCDPETMRYLMEIGGEKSSNEAVELAAARYSKPVSQCLVENGAKVSDEAIVLATAHNNPETIEYMVENCDEISSLTIQKALSHATIRAAANYNKNLEVVDYLRKKGSEIINNNKVEEDKAEVADHNSELTPEAHQQDYYDQV